MCIKYHRNARCIGRVVFQVCDASCIVGKMKLDLHVCKQNKLETIFNGLSADRKKFVHGQTAAEDPVQYPETPASKIILPNNQKIVKVCPGAKFSKLAY